MFDTVIDGDWLEGKNGEDDGTFDGHWGYVKAAQRKVCFHFLHILSYLTSPATSIRSTRPVHANSYVTILFANYNVYLI